MESSGWVRWGGIGGRWRRGEGRKWGGIREKRVGRRNGEGAVGGGE